MGCTSTKMHESGPQGLVSCSRHSLWDALQLKCIESGPQGLVSCSRHSLWDALQLKCMSLDLKDWCLVADIHYGMHFN